jgi:hypothetical protein
MLYPEIFLSYKGISVYYAYANNDYNNLSKWQFSLYESLNPFSLIPLFTFDLRDYTHLVNAYIPSKSNNYMDSREAEIAIRQLIDDNYLREDGIYEHFERKLEKQNLTLNLEWN